MKIFNNTPREVAVMVYRFFVALCIAYLLFMVTGACDKERFDIPESTCPEWVVTEVYTKEYAYGFDPRNTGYEGWWITAELTTKTYKEGQKERSCTEHRASFVKYRLLEITEDNAKIVEEYILVREDLTN